MRSTRAVEFCKLYGAKESVENYSEYEMTRGLQERSLRREARTVSGPTK